MDELQKLIDIQSSDEELKCSVNCWDNLIYLIYVPVLPSTFALRNHTHRAFGALCQFMPTQKQIAFANFFYPFWYNCAQTVTSLNSTIQTQHPSLNSN